MSDDYENPDIRWQGMEIMGPVLDTRSRLAIEQADQRIAEFYAFLGAPDHYESDELGIPFYDVEGDIGREHANNLYEQLAKHHTMTLRELLASLNIPAHLLGPTHSFPPEE